MSAKGSAILLAARSKFRESREQGTLQKIEVPEWDCAVYYWPEMSVNERRGVFKHLRGSSEGMLSADSLISAAIAQVLLRARDEFGVLLFGESDEAAVLDTDPNVLQRIANAMGFGSGPSLEGAEKN